MRLVETAVSDMNAICATSGNAQYPTTTTTTWQVHTGLPAATSRDDCRVSAAVARTQQRRNPREEEEIVTSLTIATTRY